MVSTQPDTTASPSPRKRKPSPSRATQPKFERLDIAAESQVGYDKTIAELAPITDDVERFKAASKIASDAAAKTKTLREKRHKLAVGLAAYHGVRAVHEAAGMWRDHMRRVTLRTLKVDRLPTMADRADADPDLAKKTNVPDHDALEELAKAARVPKPKRKVETELAALADIGRKYLRLDGSRKAAITVRDDLALQLSEDSVMTWDEISTIMGAYHGNRYAFIRAYESKGK